MKIIRFLKMLDEIQKYGLKSQVILLYNHKIKHDYSDYDLKIKRQTFYHNLDKSKYETELKKWYYFRTGHKLNLDCPKRFTEKVQWLKLYGFGDLETRLVDKYLVRDWVKEQIGEQYLIPLYGVWADPEDIDYDKLPKSFMLKGNHGSQMNIRVNDKDNLDIENLTDTLKRWLSLDFAHCLGGFELQYESVPRRIIAEEIMIDDGKCDLDDYKFHCFNGVPKFCEVISGRSEIETIDYYDMEWVHQDFIDEPESSAIKNSTYKIPMPANFQEMKRIASKLSGGFPYVRVDLYSINNRIYFGEMTFTPASGGDKFTPDAADFMLGELLSIDGIRNLS